MDLGGPKEPLIRLGASHVANTIEPTMCGDDAAFYQITSTTCVVTVLPFSNYIQLRINGVKSVEGSVDRGVDWRSDNDTVQWVKVD